MKELIVIVDDEPEIIKVLTHNLEKEKFRARGFLKTTDFLEFLEKNVPDLVILDLMLPDGDGFELCKYMRSEERFKHVPIIMLTARGDETDRVLGLELGADDYVVKPFSPRELVARVKAVLRRRKVPEPEKDFLEIGGILKIDLTGYKIYVKEKEINLTPTEFKILSLLARRRGWVFTRRQILEAIYEEKFVIDRTVDVHIKNIREKLGPAGELIKNVRGVGYKIEE